MADPEITYSLKVERKPGSSKARADFRCFTTALGALVEDGETLDDVWGRYLRREILTLAARKLDVGMAALIAETLSSQNGSPAGEFQAILWLSVDDKPRIVLRERDPA